MKKDYPGLGNRSMFYPSSSYTFTFDAVEDTGSNPASNVSLEETLARSGSPLKTYLPGSPGNETKRVGQAHRRIRFRRPRRSRRSEGGKSFIRIALGWVIDRFFTLAPSPSVAGCRWHRWSEDVDESQGSTALLGAEIEPVREWVPLLCVVVVSPTRLARSAESLAMSGKARRRASTTGDAEGSGVGVLGVSTSSCPHL